MCLAAIYWARIEKIYFANTAADARDIGFDDDLVYGELQLPRSERRIPYRQLLRDEALAVFREWRNTAGPHLRTRTTRGHGPIRGSERCTPGWIPNGSGASGCRRAAPPVRVDFTGHRP